MKKIAKTLSISAQKLPRHTKPNSPGKIRNFEAIKHLT
jgi:hypothetical protein